MPEHMRQKAQDAYNRVISRQCPEFSPSRPLKRQRGDEEHHEQVDFISRIKQLAEADPRYALAVRRTFAIPNGGKRSKREAGRLKAEGVKAGVSDIECSLPTRRYVGLFIEMKSLTGSASDEQRKWINESRDLGYCAEVCRGAVAAFRVWKDYVDAGF